MPSVFLSHSHEDKVVAAKIKEALERAGCGSVFLACDPESGIAPGEDWERQLYRRLEACDALVAVCSERSLASKWCFAEMTQARARGTPVIPVKVSPCELPHPLQGIHAVEWMDGDAAALDVLASRVRAEVRPGRRWGRTLRRRWLLAALVLALVASGVWYFTRSGSLTVTTVPGSSLVLDGERLGTTPVASRSVASGEHELRLERDLFTTFVRRFHLAPGSTYEIHQGLEPVDPGNAEALRILAKAMGLGITEAPEDRVRGTSPRGGVAVLFPRGDVLEPPRAVRLWTGDVAEGTRITLSGPTEGRDQRIGNWAVPTTMGEREAEIPAEVRGQLRPGSGYRLGVIDASGGRLATTEFHVVDPATRHRVEEELHRVGNAFRADVPAVEFLRVEVLLAEGLRGDAYDRTVALSTMLGPRREVGRAALAILEAAGARNTPWWLEWVEAFERAEK